MVLGLLRYDGGGGGGGGGETTRVENSGKRTLGEMS